LDTTEENPNLIKLGQAISEIVRIDDPYSMAHIPLFQDVMAALKAIKDSNDDEQKQAAKALLYKLPEEARDDCLIYMDPLFQKSPLQPHEATVMTATPSTKSKQLGATKLIKTRLDFSEPPAFEAQFEGIQEITIGDLHGNPLSLLFYLVKCGVLKL